MHTNPLSWNGNSWNGDSRTIVLADVNKQKQHSETRSFSVGKKDESAYQQITCLIRVKPMLIEITYGSQVAFLLEFGQSRTGGLPGRVKLHSLPSGINF